MAITKKPTKLVQDTAAAAAEAFISGAPDAASATPQALRRVRKGRKVQISLTIAEPLLDRVDELAREIGQSRAAVINLAVMQMLQRGLHIGGE
jgi:hypothetical protein